MNWLFLTILSITSRAVYSIAVKIQSTQARVSAITMSVLLTFFGSILTILISPLIGGISIKEIENIWMLTAIMILSQTVGNILFFKGLEKLDAGSTQIAFSSILIWGTILSAIFLKSNFSLKQGIGIVMLLFAIIFIQYRKDRKKLNGYILYIIASAGLFSIFQVSSAGLAETMSTGTYLFLSYFGSTIITMIVYFKTVVKDFQVIKKNTVVVGRNALFVSGTSLLYLLFSYFAYQIAPDRGVVVILLTTQVILSVILGIIFLNEREGMKRKLLAGVIALIAGILIKS